ncbi:hypothetical protein OSB04_015331 [Centaurea solstitialis]|uniref:RNA helicase n=1 Tax=Centaurea solstitialis TaxID=347529 RepID=A0AA38WK15_9ASTR|nr:hypothetical protein OSB04_015331 [Centaurea solstitialis]
MVGVGRWRWVEVGATSGCCWWVEVGVADGWRWVLLVGGGGGWWRWVEVVVVVGVVVKIMSQSKEPSLKKLEYLSLVSKVCTELESHLGFGDKVLAEFITEIGRKCETVDEFDRKLKENGAEMPDYFVRTLLTIIHAILPPKRKFKSDKEGGKKDDNGQKSSFPALNIGDSKDRVKELEREIEMEARERRKRDGEVGGGDDGGRDYRDRDTDRGRGRDRDRDRDRDRRASRRGRENDDRHDRRERGR